MQITPIHPVEAIRFTTGLTRRSGDKLPEVPYKASAFRPELSLKLPLYASRVAAGFPSPADDYLEGELDLNKYLIAHPSATYLARADGDSLLNLGICTGDLLIVDRSLTPREGDVVVAAVDGQLCCKILDLANHQLLSANDSYPPIVLAPGSQLDIEGVVVHAVHHLRGA